MISISKFIRALALAGLVVMASAAQALAAPIISISPASQEVPLGPGIFVDILVSGLGASEEVGGFSLDLSFDDTILSGSSFVNDPDGKMGAGFDFFSGFAGGVLTLAYVGEDFAPFGPGPEDDAALKALQGTGFTLARVGFTGIAPGVSPLSLAPIGAFLSDGQGFVLGAQAVGGQVCVGGVPCPAQAPEPATLSLLGAGLCALVVRRRRQTRLQH